MISKIGSVICICFVISLFAIGGGSGEKEIPQMAKFRPTMKFLYWWVALCVISMAKMS